MKPSNLLAAALIGLVLWYIIALIVFRVAGWDIDCSGSLGVVRDLCSGLDAGPSRG